MEDRLHVGRRLRASNILHQGVREAVHVAIDTAQAISPKGIKLKNGGESPTTLELSLLK